MIWSWAIALLPQHKVLSQALYSIWLKVDVRYIGINSYEERMLWMATEVEPLRYVAGKA
jgi:hypothetical protein